MRREKHVVPQYNQQCLLEDIETSHGNTTGTLTRLILSDTLFFISSIESRLYNFSPSPHGIL